MWQNNRVQSAGVSFRQSAAGSVFSFSSSSVRYRPAWQNLSELVLCAVSLLPLSSSVSVKRFWTLLSVRWDWTSSSHPKQKVQSMPGCALTAGCGSDPPQRRNELHAIVFSWIWRLANSSERQEAEVSSNRTRPDEARLQREEERQELGQARGEIPAEVCQTTGGPIRIQRHSSHTYRVSQHQASGPDSWLMGWSTTRDFNLESCPAPFIVNADL